MRAASPLVTATLLLLACTMEADRGGFGEAPQPTHEPSSSPADQAPEEPTQIVRVTAAEGLSFEPTALEIRAGELTRFELTNEDGQDHTFVVSELPVAMLAAPGQTVEATTPVAAGNRGRFAFFCSIPGHREGGMEGLLRVA